MSVRQIPPQAGQQLQQSIEAGAVVADPQLGQLGAVLIDQRDVVVVLGPVDAAALANTCVRAYVERPASHAERWSDHAPVSAFFDRDQLH